MDVLATVSTAIRLADDFPQADDAPPRHELAVLDKIALDRHPVAVFTDVTGLKRAEQALLAAQARLSHLLTSSPAVLYSFGAKGDHLGPQ